MTKHRKNNKRHKHIINEKIRSQEVRVVDASGEQLGVLPTAEALQQAEDLDLDLVVIAEKASPPVVKMIRYSKFVYDLERKQKTSRSAQSKPPKQVQSGPNINEHDYQTKRRQVEKFLIKGEKVKIVVRMRGLQKAHPEIAVNLVQRFMQEVPGSTPDPPKREGDKVTTILSPDKEKIKQLEQE